LDPVRGKPDQGEPAAPVKALVEKPAEAHDYGRNFRTAQYLPAIPAKAGIQ